MGLESLGPFRQANNHPAGEPQDSSELGVVVSIRSTRGGEDIILRRVLPGCSYRRRVWRGQWFFGLFSFSEVCDRVRNLPILTAYRKS
jgi:hypothetical protein